MQRCEKHAETKTDPRKGVRALGVGGEALVPEETPMCWDGESAA